MRRSRADNTWETCGEPRLGRRGRVEVVGMTASSAMSNSDTMDSTWGVKEEEVEEGEK